MKSKGILEDKLKTYYSDAKLADYKDNFLRGLSKFTGSNFKEVLDIGAGVGTFYDAIKPFGYNYVAIEGSDYGYKTCLEKSIKCKKLSLKKGSKLPFQDNAFSLVFMNQVIEHLDRETGAFYIKDILRVLEPGGVAIINSPSKYSRIWNTDPHHIYCWRPNELLQEVSQYNDKLLSIDLLRSPLEFWMFNKYNEDIINTWHKYNKYPKVKKFLRLFVKLLDKIYYAITKGDHLLASSNIIFVKK